MKKKRIFLALNIEEVAREELSLVQEELRTSIERGVTWSDKKTLHVTLFFFGLIKDSDISKAQKIIERIKLEKFMVSLKRVNYFPENIEKAKIIYATIDSRGLITTRELMKKQLLRDFKLIEGDSYFPHITLGRIKSWEFKKNQEEDVISINRDLNIDFLASSCTLFESTTQGGRLIHNPVFDFKFNEA